MILKAAIAIVAAAFAFPAAFLVTPTALSGPDFGEYPKDPPVALVPDANNKGRRCEANTVYVSAAEPTPPEGAVVDDLCSGLQNELADAAHAADAEAIRKALAKGASAGSNAFRDNLGWFPVLSAVNSGKPELLKLLLDNGADPSGHYVCCAGGSSWLMAAVGRNDVAMARLLLARGADTGYRRHEGEPAWGGLVYEEAAKSDSEEIRALFREVCEADLECRIGTRLRTLRGLVE